MSIMYYEYKENQLALNIKCLWYVELKNLGIKNLVFIFSFKLQNFFIYMLKAIKLLVFN